MEWFQGVVGIGIGICQTYLMYLSYRAMKPLAAGRPRSSQRWRMYWPLAAMLVLAILGWAPVWGPRLAPGLFASVDPPTTVENIEERIRAWMDEYGYGIQRDTAPNVYFRFLITTLDNRTLYVTRQSHDASVAKYLLVEANLEQGEDAWQVYQRLKPEQREAIEREVKMVLLGARLQYILNLVGPPMRKIQIVQAVPITNQLDAHEFIKTIAEVHTVRLLLIELLTDRLKRARVAMATP